MPEPSDQRRTPGRDPDPEPDRSDAVSVRRVDRHRRAVVLVLGVGLILRFFVAAHTHNADAATLTWGSAFVADGHLDPWSEVIDHPELDPIDVTNMRSLSLAQSYVGVYVGAVPVWIGDHLGLIHVGDPPDGRSFGVGELFAYKLSYLVPEAIIVGLLARWTQGQRRVWALAAWATNPLIVFTWGQGMPDTWTVAIALVGLYLLRRAAQDVTSPARTYTVAGTVIALGAFGTKLLPLVLFLPLAFQIAGDDRLRGRRGRITVPVLAVAGVAAAPFAMDALRTNVTERFEFDMMNGETAISSAHGFADVQWSMLVLVGATLWFLVRRRAPFRNEVWVSAAIVSLTLLSGLLPHLMFWMTIPLLLVAIHRPAIAAFASVAFGVAMIWHGLSYSWFRNLVAGAVDRGHAVTGFPQVWIESFVPAHKSVASLVSTLLLAGAVALVVWLLAGPWLDQKVPLVDSPKVLRGFGVAGALLVMALVANGFLAEKVGPTVWAQGEVGSQPLALSLESGASWISPPLPVAGTVTTAQIRINRASLPSRDLIEVAIVDDANTALAHAVVEEYKAEAASDSSAVWLTFDRPVELQGNRIRITHLAGSGGSGDDRPVSLDAAYVSDVVFDPPDPGGAVQAGQQALVPMLSLSEDRSGAFVGDLMARLADVRTLAALLSVVVLAVGAGRVVAVVAPGPLAEP